MDYVRTDYIRTADCGLCIVCTYTDYCNPYLILHGAMAGLVKASCSVGLQVGYRHQLGLDRTKWARRSVPRSLSFARWTLLAGLCNAGSMAFFLLFFLFFFGPGVVSVAFGSTRCQGFAFFHVCRSVVGSSALAQKGIISVCWTTAYAHAYIITLDIFQT